MAVKFIFGDRFQWRKVVNPRVVDQHVESSECRLGVLEKALHVIGFGDVALNRDRLATLLFDRIENTIRSCYTENVNNHDRNSSLSQTLCNTRSKRLRN